MTLQCLPYSVCPGAPLAELAPFKCSGGMTQRKNSEQRSGDIAGSAHTLQKEGVITVPELSAWGQ